MMQRGGFIGIDKLARAGVHVHVRLFFVNAFLVIHCASQSRGYMFTVYLLT